MQASCLRVLLNSGHMFVKLMSYHPAPLTAQVRCVSHACSTVSVLAMQGTQRRAELGVDVRKFGLPHHNEYSFNWHPGLFMSKAACVSTLMGMLCGNEEWFPALGGHQYTSLAVCVCVACPLASLLSGCRRRSPRARTCLRGSDMVAWAKATHRRTGAIMVARLMLNSRVPVPAPRIGSLAGRPLRSSSHLRRERWQ